MKYLLFISVATILFATSCKKQNQFSADFDNTNDRIWVGKDFWSIPFEDWKVENGKLVCVGEVPNSRVNLLTHVISAEAGDFQVSSKIMLGEKGDVPGSAGFLIGAHDEEDPDVRAACYFGGGIKAGVSLSGFAFLKDEKVVLPVGFDFSEFNITVSGNNTDLKMKIADKNSIQAEISTKIDGIQGLIVLANNMNLGGNEKPGKSKFAFDDLKISGSKVIEKPENAFGPILWTMHTLSKGTVKLMAILPPVENEDNQDVSLQLKKGEKWETVATETLEPDSKTVVFKLEKWDATQNVEYRVEYIEQAKDGSETPNFYAGTIRKDPVDKPLKFGGLTCQYTSGFPYTPLVNNLTKLNPDLLYFSGDQIYEPNGGYQIKREPGDVSVLSYLGKYYMFGWAFGDLMRDVPTICTPDDHDVFHGNLWGEGGIAKPGGAGYSGFRPDLWEIRHNWADY